MIGQQKYSRNKHFKVFMILQNVHPVSMTDSSLRMETPCIFTSSFIIKCVLTLILKFPIGEVGRRTFEEIQLSTHGFQGLQVRK